jgi:hypothetical protein
LSTNLILKNEIVKKILTKKLAKAKKKKKTTKKMRIKFERKIAKNDEIEKQNPKPNK